MNCQCLAAAFQIVQIEMVNWNNFFRTMSMYLENVVWCGFSANLKNKCFAFFAFIGHTVFENVTWTFFKVHRYIWLNPMLWRAIEIWFEVGSDLRRHWLHLTVTCGISIPWSAGYTKMAQFFQTACRNFDDITANVMTGPIQRMTMITIHHD